MLHLENVIVWNRNVDPLESRSEIPERFSNVVLKKDREDQLD